MSPGRGQDRVEVAAGDRRGGGLVGRGVAFWLIAYMFAVSMVGTTLPTPLYVIYQSEWGFSDGVVTVIYATYAFGVLAALLFLGRASDQVGRRPVLGVVIVLAALSTVVFIVANGLGALFAGRVVSGLAAGLVTGTATASLSELVTRGGTRHAALVATVVNMGGLGLGPLLAGLFAEYAPRPTVLVFVVYLGLLVPAALAVVAAPETVRNRRRLSLSFAGLGVPTEVRTEFLSASVAAFCSFTILGLFSALAPSFLGKVLHEHNHAVGGSVVFLIFASATVAEVAFRGVANRRAMAVGLAWMIAGLALIMVGLSLHSLTVFVIATPVAGLGAGLVFMASLATANQLAPPQRRGQVISTYFVVAYVGLTIPVIGVGVSSVHVGDFRATLGCSIAIAVLVALVAAGMRRGGRRRASTEG